jgi:transglutaminase-like putative cysteine protease
VSLVWFSAPDAQPTHAGDVVITQRVTFASQEHQVRYLRQLVEVYRCHPAIRARARDIIFNVAHADPRNEAAYAIALAQWVQTNIRYVKELPEVFQVPTATVSLAAGDCDDHVTLLGSLLESVGIVSELVALEWAAPKGSDRPRALQHIYCQAVIGNRWRLPLDTTLQRPIEELTDPLRVGRAAGLALRVYVA